MTAVILAVVVLLALTFTYSNGFQDGSSVAATAITSRALSPLQAVALVGTFEFLGAMLGGSSVAATIQSITDWPTKPNVLPLLASGLLAAVCWNVVTRVLRLPSSSTHALIGGIIGGVIAGSGTTRYIEWGQVADIVHSTGVARVAISLFLSPVIGFVFGYACLRLIYALLIRASTRVNRQIKQLQWVSVACLAFGHGANDTQKAMGILILSLQSVGLWRENYIPWWIRVAVGIAMVLGIFSMAPGIVKRVGSGIYRLRPVHALTTQISSAGILLVASVIGGPVSATQVISSTVMGVGAAERSKGVHWLVAKEMLMAWFLTMPAAAILAIILHFALCQWMNACLPA